MIKRLSFLVLTLILAGSLAGCTKAAKVAVAADDVTHDGLAYFDTALDVRCDSGGLLPATCVELNKLLVPTWASYITINRSIAAGGNIDQIPDQVNALKANINTLIDAVNKLVTAESTRTLLVAELVRALNEVATRGRQ